VPTPGPTLVYACGQCEIDLSRRELRAGGAPVPIGGRAFDVLEAMVRADGKVVTKDDLMLSVWAGAIVEENTLQVYIAAIRKALGSDRGLLKTVSGRGYQMAGNWTAPSAIVSETVDVRAVPRRARTVPANLPLAAPDLVGRDAVVRQLTDLSSAHRVVTLTGPGGIGKTRLALQVARDILPGFDGDGWLVDLATISDPGLVSTAAGAVLGLMFGADPVSAVTVAQAIGSRKLLLVLDNCEHVIDAAARLVEAIVRGCPRASILATSRELLRIEGEYAFRVPPLDLPVPDAQGPQELLRHSAVQLFITRMGASQSALSLDDKDLAVIAGICRRLDGIPLAIEFAAARAATLGLEVVLSRLDERFNLLTVGRRTALPRHKTLRATLDWSYELLPDQEKSLLRFLGIFPAGFSLEGADAVMGTAAQTLDSMGNLVEKSLVAAEGHRAAGRWRLLETTRAYALEKLNELGEADLAARRHASYVRDLLARLDASTEPYSVTERMGPYAREIDNVRAALDWAFSPAGDAVIGIALTAAFIPAWLHLSLLVECRERITHALAQLQAQVTISACLGMQLHIALGISLVFTTGLVIRTEEVLAKGLELAEGLDDLDNQLVALWILWFYHMTGGELRVAEPFATRFQATAVRSGAPPDLLLGDQIIASTMHFKGDQPEARRSLERRLAFPALPSDGRHSTWILSDVQVPARTMLARVLLLQGFIDRAGRDARSSFEDELARGRPVAICTVLRYGVCSIALTNRDLETAEWSIPMLNDLAERHGSAFWSRIGRCLEGAYLIKRGDFVAGTATLKAALATVKNRPPDLLAILAEGSAGLGQLTEAIATIDERLERSNNTGEQWYDPELHRIKGELVWQPESGLYDAAAEACFHTAIELARHQGAVLWELKACLSLAGLRVRQKRNADAYRDLAPVYKKFTEGLGSPEPRFARELLEAIDTGGAGMFRQAFDRHF
jgi:predicted ATPase/DNA-binding winged helix-turn-helix (wHTH) protein